MPTMRPHLHEEAWRYPIWASRFVFGQYPTQLFSFLSVSKYSAE